MDTPHIRTAEGTEAERAVTTLMMAFAADPVMRWLWPEADAYLRNFPRLVRAFGGRAFDHGGAFVDDDFGGASLWLRPGVEPDGEAVEALFRETLAGSKRDDAFEVLDQMAKHHTSEPHGYLAFIGVDVARQGGGLGSFILRSGLAEVCDGEGIHGWLESSNPANVSLYRRHGFEVAAAIQAGSSPTMQAMVRRPA